MSTTYHVNPMTGEVSHCKALIVCPFGDGPGTHYGTPGEVRAYFEDSMQAQTFMLLKKNGGKIPLALSMDYHFMLTKRAVRATWRKARAEAILAVTGASMTDSNPHGGPPITDILKTSVQVTGIRTLGRTTARALPLTVVTSAAATNVITGVTAGALIVGVGFFGRKAFKEQEELLLK